VSLILLKEIARTTRLEVPAYKQHFDFTCGPASIMMAMKYFDEKLRLSEDLEMDVWREANMVEIYGTSRYGLAFSAAKRGFQVKIFANIVREGFVRELEPMIGKVDEKMLSFFFRERKQRCAELGVVEKKVATVSKNLLRDCLKSEAVPVVLSNTEYFSAEDVPHWIVICAIDENNIYFNNPLCRKKGESAPLGSLKQIIGYKGDQCMVAISKKIKGRGLINV
jgi:hypothetical protein